VPAELDATGCVLAGALLSATEAADIAAIN
jgi:hypothetical protein